MKILLLGVNYVPEPTGIAPYTTGLAEGLAGRGHQVRVLTSHPHYPSWSLADDAPHTAKLVQNGVSVERHRHYVPSAPGSFNRAVFEIAFGARIVRRDWKRPDAVVCVSPALLSTAMCFARARLSRTRPALGLIVQDLYSSGMAEFGGPSRAEKLLTGVEQHTMRVADGVAVIHERFAEQISDRFGVNRGRIDVIRNWAHVPPVAAHDRQEFRRLMRWRDDEVVVLHAGAMGVKQGLENVVEAARLAESRRDKVRFVLLGDGSQRASLEVRAAGATAVQFLDPLEQPAFSQALEAADVLLVNERPGVREMAVPSKLTTYFTAAKPILAATEADSTTAAEVAASGAGLRVPPGDPDALVAGVHALTADRSSAQDMGRQGRRYATALLSPDAAIEAYDAWIRKLVHGRVSKSMPLASRRYPGSHDLNQVKKSVLERRARVPSKSCFTRSAVG